jgi:hypothetical protein
MDDKPDFELMKFSVVTHLSKEFAIEPVVKVFDYLAESIVAVVRQAIVGDLLDEIEVKYPADWWQAVKEHFAPIWFKKQWPVKNHHVKLTARALYPKVKIITDQPVIINLEDKHKEITDEY